MRLRKKAGIVVDRAPRVRILHEHAAHAAVHRETAVVAHHDLDAERPGPGPHEVDRLRMAPGGDEEHAARALFHAMAQHHRLGGGGALIEHRGVGDFKPGEVTDHRLVIEQGLEAALGNLGLVWRVRSVPAGVFQNGALDDGRRERVVITQTDEAAEHLVFAGDGAQFGQGGALACRRRQAQGTAHPDGGRHGRLHQGVERRCAEGGEHRGDAGLIGAEMAGREKIGRNERIAGKSHTGGR